MPEGFYVFTNQGKEEGERDRENEIIGIDQICNQLQVNLQQKVEESSKLG
jgi:hypothetical protein